MGGAVTAQGSASGTIRGGPLSAMLDLGGRKLPFRSRWQVTHVSVALDNGSLVCGEGLVVKANGCRAGLSKLPRV